MINRTNFCAPVLLNNLTCYQNHDKCSNGPFILSLLSNFLIKSIISCKILYITTIYFLLSTFLVLYFRRDILVVTAKVLHNTLVQKDIDSIQTFSLIVFDECHHTQADHPYNEMMNLYHELKSAHNFDSSALPQVSNILPTAV